MEFERLFYMIRSRIKLVAVTAMIVLAAAILGRLVIAPSYRAVASVIVDTRGINPVSGNATQSPMASESVLGTYANITRSEAMALKVLAELPKPDATRALWEESSAHAIVPFEAWAARQISRNVDVRTGGQSSQVLDISYTDKDPSEAASIANLYASNLLRYSQEMRNGPARQDAGYFKEQSEALRKETSDAAERLAAFQREHAITSSTDGRIDVESARLTAINAQSVLNQDSSYDAQSRAAQANGSGSSADVLSNPLIQSLTEEVARREARVNELASRLGESHPDMIQARAQLAQSRSALARESGKAAQSISTSSAAAKARAQALRADGDEQRKKVVELNALRVQLVSLEQDLAQKRKLYEGAVQRNNEASLEAGSQRADLQLLVKASPPNARTGPGLSTIAPLALVTGALLAMLLILLLEKISPRMNHNNDFEELGLPVLETIPLMRVR